MAQNRVAKIASILLALFFWQLGAMALKQNILLVTPLEVLKELAKQVCQGAFWLTVWFSFLRISIGFLLALALGSLFASLSYRFKAFEVFIWPYVTVMKSTPVASIIVLCLIWFSSSNLSVLVSFLIVMPVVYANIFQGLCGTDKNLLEMGQVMRMRLLKRVKYIYLPQLGPYLISACSASIGMAWKAGVAAEIIGIPRGSIGERLYEAKIYLSSGELFAWTVVIITVSVVFEKLFLQGLKLMYQRLERS